ncbi:hypothetical protein [Escherichia phage Ecp_YSF]|nr:hypothetical protein [Escherichia phage Ecp_YSF]
MPISHVLAVSVLTQYSCNPHEYWLPAKRRLYHRM